MRPEPAADSRKACIVCTSRHSRVVFREFAIDVLRCLGCGHVFSSQTVDQHYDGFFGDQPIEADEQFWWSEAHLQMYADFCRRFIAGKRGRLLDVGCGLGYFVKTLSAYPGWRAFGYEISRQAVDFARTKLGLPNVLRGRVEASGFPPGSFDIITLWDVIEHVPDPDPLLSYLASRLKPTGLLFMHTPNIAIQLRKARLKKAIWGMKADVPYLEARDHVNIYSTTTIKAVLERNGFADIQFTHLRPVQGVAGRRSRLLTAVKNAWFHAAVAMDRLTFGRVNLDNLFVVARPAS